MLLTIPVHHPENMEIIPILKSFLKHTSNKKWTKATIYHTLLNHRNKKIHEVSRLIVENNFKAE